MPYHCGVLFGLGSSAYGVALTAVCLLGGAAGAAYSPATIKPILSEVAPPSRRAAAIAWQYLVAEAGGAIFGTLGPASLAGRFGYVAYTVPISHLTPAERQANATALAHAVLAFCVPAWALCVLIYSAVVCTYPRDRALAEAKAAASSVVCSSSP